MPLNKPSGNMYPWAYTWNPYGGLCLYACDYCYVRNKIAPWLNRLGILKYVGAPRLIEKELKTKLTIPEKYIIFVCSNNDLFGYWVQQEDIDRILSHCRQFDSWFLFQTKNPIKLIDYLDKFPQKTILGTTIETNRDHGITKAPPPEERYLDIMKLDHLLKGRYPIMVSMEPIQDFDLEIMLKWIASIEPLFISIGADSGENNLKEPEQDKLRQLISQAELITEVRIKKNLKRLM